MKNFVSDFNCFGDNIWLNTASEGPLPVVGQTALNEVLQWKSHPYQLTIPRFIQIQKDLKKSLGELFHLPANEVILANSASYGLHVLANGFPFNQGDQVICMQNDFPTNILPWLGLQKRGVVVKQVKARDHLITLEEFKASITPATKFLCLSHVHTFSGRMIDVKRFAQICRENNIFFVLNVAQSAGTMPLDIKDLQVDAIVGAGYKWLCGPYGTGYAWFKNELREQLDYNHAYWPNVLSEEQVQSEEALEYSENKSAEALDVFGTANFFNFAPFNAAIQYWLKVGLERVYEHNQSLINILLAGLNRNKFSVVSDEVGALRSNLVVISHKDFSKNAAIHKVLLEKKIYTALWKGRIRISPHVFNTEEEMGIIVAALNNEN